MDLARVFKEDFPSEAKPQDILDGSAEARTRRKTSTSLSAKDREGSVNSGTPRRNDSANALRNWAKSRQPRRPLPVIFIDI